MSNHPRSGQVTHFCFLFQIPSVLLLQDIFYSALAQNSHHLGITKHRRVHFNTAMLEVCMPADESHLSEWSVFLGSLPSSVRFTAALLVLR
eukprot:scaffold38233_cov20-Tisochrysis_lutea.AAC.3